MSGTNGVTNNLGNKRPITEQKGLLENIELCEKIMTQMMLKDNIGRCAERGHMHQEIIRKPSKTFLNVKPQPNLRSCSLQILGQKKSTLGKQNNGATRQSHFGKSLTKKSPHTVKENTQENISLLLSHILTDGSDQLTDYNGSAGVCISAEVPEQPSISVKKINSVTEENNKIVKQDCAVQTTEVLSAPRTKTSKSIQVSSLKPTTNSVGIDCNILNFNSKRDDISPLLDENNKLIAQQKAQIEQLKQTLSSEQYQIRSLSSQLYKNQLEFDKARLNWLQKENQFKAEKERFNQKMSSVLTTKDQVIRNLETSREYIKLLEGRISMLERSHSNVRQFSRCSELISPDRCESYSSDSEYSRIYLKNIDSVRSTPDLSATFPTLSKLLLISNEYQNTRNCLTACSYKTSSKNFQTNQSCQTKWNNEQYWRRSPQHSHNLDRFFEGDCISASSTLTRSDTTDIHIRKSEIDHQDTTERSDYKHFSIPSASSSISSLHAVDELEFQNNLALLDQRINSIRDSLRLNPVT
ncbi:unnamed protein product [Trichobilharzia szidati]|nr:unnamed protein product [Trichobilharzia szidati]